MNDDIIVSIICNCYNQSEYISSCLEGFLNQKVSFKYEILIHDDASDDGTIEIIEKYQKRYPDVIKIFTEEHNRFKEPHVNYTYEFGLLNAKGKYIAFCEGDDCWIAPNKLQTEIDYLENNSSCGLVYTNAIAYNVSRQQFSQKGVAYKCENFDELLLGNGIPTATVCYRKELGLNYYEEIKPWLRGWKMGDYPLWLWISDRCEIKYIPIVTAVYRILDESASHTRDVQKRLVFAQSTYDIRYYFLKRYSASKNKIDEYYLKYMKTRYELEQIYSLKTAKEMRKFICKSRVASFRLFAVLIASLSKPSFWLLIKYLEYINGTKYVDEPNTGSPDKDEYVLCLISKNRDISE